MSSSTSCLYGTIYSYSPPTRTQLLPTNMSPRSLIGLFQTGGLSTTHGATYPLWKDIVKDLQPDIKYTGMSASCSLDGRWGAGSSASSPGLQVGSQWRCTTVPVPPGNAALGPPGPQLAMQIASKAGVECSDSEMKALQCGGNVQSAERDEKELRGWVFFIPGDRQFTGRFPSSFFKSMELWTAQASVPNSYM